MKKTMVIAGTGLLLAGGTVAVLRYRKIHTQ